MIEAFVKYYTSRLDGYHVAQILLIAFCIAFVFTPPKRNRKSILIFTARIVIIAVAYSLLEALYVGIFVISPPLQRLNSLFANITATALYGMFFSKYKKNIIMILIGVVSATVVLVSDCLRDVCYFYTGPGNETLVGMLIILVNLLLVPLGLLINRFNLNRFIAIPRKNTVLIIVSCFIVIIFVAISLVMQTVLNADGRDAVRMILAIIGVALLFIHFLNYLNLYFICERSDAELELQAQNKIIQANADMLNLTDRNLKDIRAFMHDSENMFAYMAMLLRLGEYDELQKYLDSVAKNHLESLSIIDCGNKMISNILNMEKGKADACGVNFSTSLNVPPVLPFDEGTFCSLLTNMIDNAIEACVRKNIENGEVRINISIMQEYLFIQVVNPIPPNTDKESLLSLTTEKSDVKNHGYGTRIIKQIAAKYNGHAMFSVEGDKFVAEAMLDLLSDERKK